MVIEPPWLLHARTQIGVREIGNTNESPTILGWLKGLGWGWLKRAPWCGVFVAEMLRQSGITPSKTGFRAKDWLNWGKPCEPTLGSICVLDREGGGHVFFPTKISQSFIWGIGGNQGNAVNEGKFARSRVLGYRWPAMLPVGFRLPQVADGGGPVSENEQ
jgi:uncharacterized protein (TIGR02594 family)